MRKISLILSVSLMLSMFCGCSSDGESISSAPPVSSVTDTADSTADISQNDDTTVNEDSTTTSPSDDEELTVPESPEPGNNEIVADDGMLAVENTIGKEVFAAKFYDNESARAIIAQMPFSLDMGDYAKQEKVTDLSFDLPDTSTERPDTINIGDIYLWSGNNLVLFYTTFSNSYSYVPIGYIEDTTGLVAALGSGSVTVTFSASIVS